MKSLIRKHAIVINGRKTSISIEDAFWALAGQAWET